MAKALLAGLLEDRRFAIACGVAAVAHLSLTALRLPGWTCPLLGTCGVPCPGCGLSRATLALAGGNWTRAIQIHAFAPVAVIGCALLVAAIIGGPKSRLVVALKSLEERTGLTVWLLISLLLYWIARLVLDARGLLALVG